MHSTASFAFLLATVPADEAIRAIRVALIGMFLVFATLVLISFFLSILPRILNWVNTVWPETTDPHGGLVDPTVELDDEAEVLAAIGYMLHAQARESR